MRAGRRTLMAQLCIMHKWPVSGITARHAVDDMWIDGAAEQNPWTSP